MAENYRKLHQAVCDKCEAIETQSDRSTFISDFFLPDMCRQCGEYPEWIHRVITKRRVPRNRSISKPWTWVMPDMWVEHDREQWRA